MVINVHAGHNPDGKTACGAVGLIRESTEARAVKNEVIRQLEALGHTVHDCTCENGKSQADVLNKIISKCNSNAADLNVSIHFNSGVNDKSGNGKNTGTEVLIYSDSSKAKNTAANVCKEIESLGFKNRGVKVNQRLAFLRRTTEPAMLIECCFVDDKDDVDLYDSKKMASAIVCGITGQNVCRSKTSKGRKVNFESGIWYKVTTSIPVRNGYYGDVGNYDYLSDALKTACDRKSGKGYLKEGCIINPVEVKTFNDGSVWFKLDPTITCMIVATDGTTYVEKA